MDSQVGRYRSLLAGRRVLAVLDNARDAEQVRPLLPGVPGCLVLVTSRNRLSSLVTREGAQPLALDPLSAEQARLLLARRLGHDRIADEPAAVDEVVGRCAGLPLALAIVAARAAARPRPTLSTLAEQLRDAALDALSAGDPASDLRCVFSWSYHALEPAAARLLRLLGHHPGPEFSTAAAASLAAVPEPRLRPLLAALTEANLLTEPAPGRYAIHDLFHAYAAELAEPAEGRAAVHRLLDHYVHSAHAAVRRLDQQLAPIERDPPRPGVAPERPADHQQALGWLTTEALGHARKALRLSRTTGHWTGQARVLNTVGRLATLLGYHRDGLAACRRTLALFRELADRPGLAAAWDSLGYAHHRLGDHADAITCYRHALDLYRQLGDRQGELGTLTSLGDTHRSAGELPAAYTVWRQALEILIDLGHPHAEQVRARLSS